MISGLSRENLAYSIVAGFGLVPYTGSVLLTLGRRLNVLRDTRSPNMAEEKGEYLPISRRNYRHIPESRGATLKRIEEAPLV